MEKDYPMQIAFTREGVENELVNGPFWVMGNVPIERSDKSTFFAAQPSHFVLLRPVAVQTSL